MRVRFLNEEGCLIALEEISKIRNNWGDSPSIGDRKYVASLAVRVAESNKLQLQVVENIPVDEAD